ncbi:hypothetical protein SKAU_G00388360 [Synaphobranchus kaupii]|uniref:Uncharacterized protein n=1 Tax=Synaphobranchus kaupii TaxID=118154 RepID=A0A9Q1EB00_SYNKA|nr:hypothetical protein SKAU_G00388360 [Synaphobranchus kaupii]
MNCCWWSELGDEQVSPRTAGDRLELRADTPKILAGVSTSLLILGAMFPLSAPIMAVGEERRKPAGD